MNIEPQEPQYTEILDVEEGQEQQPEDTDVMSFANIYQKLLEQSDIVLTVGEDDFEALRAGITNQKYQANVKMEGAGLAKDKRRIEYVIIDKLPETHDIQVRIYFKIQAGVRVMGKAIKKFEGQGY